jgi:hypothetical protein
MTENNEEEKEEKFEKIDKPPVVRTRKKFIDNVVITEAFEIPKKTENVDDEHKIKKVTTGVILKKKKNFLNSFTQTFFGDDAKNVASYVLWDVLIPAAKNTISEMVSTGIEMLLFGEERGSRTRRDKDRSYVSYSSYYKDRDRGRDRGVRTSDRFDNRSRAQHNFDDVIIDTRAEAENVLSLLVEQIDQYDMATVADFYDLVGISSDFSDNKYGWTNLNRSEVVHTRDGYIIRLPKPYPLD